MNQNQDNLTTIQNIKYSLELSLTIPRDPNPNVYLEIYYNKCIMFNNENTILN